ncbi:hypothetical protein KW786_03525 [Candidatus Parcubacteria bacterium]|nr:hypothetical protein [Candidatus Parcubacteria bacterium]
MRIDLYLSLHESDPCNGDESAFGEGWTHFIKSVDLPCPPQEGWEFTFLKNTDDYAEVQEVRMDISGLVRVYMTGYGITAKNLRKTLQEQGWLEVEFWDTYHYDTKELVDANLVKR